MNECGDGVALQYKAAFWPSAKDLDNLKKSLTTGHTILKVWFISFVMQVATNISVLLSKSIQALAAVCATTLIKLNLLPTEVFFIIMEQEAL